MVVYFIVQDELDRPVKIGVAKDVQARRKMLQTGNPAVLKIMGWIKSNDDFELEGRLHRRFAVQRRLGEWFHIQPGDILPILIGEGANAFITKNADAFEIVGYDEDAVPEYLGVWEWGEIVLEECCPSCGCMCAMHFQDASQMYHCLNCDDLTDFSDNIDQADN